MSDPLSPAAQEAERLLSALVAIPSPSGSEFEASRYLAEWLSRHGFRARVDPTNSAVAERGKGDFEVVLLGHIDTFAGPIPTHLEGRRLFGRGAVDAKGPLAAFAAAATQVDVPAGAKLVVIGASEEEGATSRGARRALNRHHPAVCLIGEPSRWDRITLGYKGRLLIDWSWRGALAHSSGPVPSPAEQAVRFWRRVEDHSLEFNQGRQGDFARLIPSLRSLNTQNEGSFGSAGMQVAMRLPPGYSTAGLAAELRRLADGATVTFSGPEEPFVAEKNSLLTRALMGAIRQHGGQPRFVHKTGTCDMNVVGPVWQCQIAAYGPGDSQLDHTPDEFLDLDEFQLSIQILKDTLETVFREGGR